MRTTENRTGATTWGRAHTTWGRGQTTWGRQA